MFPLLNRLLGKARSVSAYPLLEVPLWEDRHVLRGEGPTFKKVPLPGFEDHVKRNREP